MPSASCAQLMTFFTMRNTPQEGIFKDTLKGSFARFCMSDTLPDIVLLESGHVCFSFAENPLQIWQKPEGPKGNHCNSHAAPDSWQHASIETVPQSPLLPDVSDHGNMQKQFLSLDVLNRFKGKMHLGLEGSRRWQRQPRSSAARTAVEILSYISK